VSLAVLAMWACGLRPSAHAQAAAAPDGAGPAGWRQELLAWRAQRAQELAAPDGWLTLVGLEWLKPGLNSFGAAADNQIRIHAQAPDHLGLLTVQAADALPRRGKHGKASRAGPAGAAAVQLLAPAGGFPPEFELDGQPASEGLLRVDGDRPSILTWHGLTMVVLSRGDRFVLRIKDAGAPTRTGFNGLDWYAPDARLRVTARWIPFVPAHIERISTVIGTTLRLPAPGVAEFTLDGKTLRLEPVIEAGEEDKLFFILRDQTSQTTTYGAGRFLHTGLPDSGLGKPGQLTLDFNHLYNPPCAYTPFATCPLPPEQNRLPVALEAGEKRYEP
jgi:uncharacterized protein (DUF1684 family)